MAPHPTLLAAVACVGVACILQVVGVATPTWLTTPSDSPVSGNVGLWETCGAGSGCITYGNDVEDWLKATRGFGIIAILVMAASAACGAMLVVKPDLAIFKQVAPILAVLGTFTSVVSVAIFAAKKEDLLADSLDFGYSFILCIVAAVLSGLSIALHMTSRKFQN